MSKKNYDCVKSVRGMDTVNQSRISISSAKGLLNMPGQNNCFLNSAVQVLWHLDIFRRSFRDLNGHACMDESCIFCALKELFNQFQYSHESALPPDALRRALAETFSDQRRFQLGFMDDAAECFENILLRIHCHIANKDSDEMCNVTHCLPYCIPHQKFAMNLIEQIICYSCGAKSDAFPFTQMVHYVSTPALVQAKQCSSEMTFGEILKKAGAVGDMRDCPNSCGGKIASIKKFLLNKPDIMSIGMVWPDIIVAGSHIMDVFCTIGTTLRLHDVFDTVNDGHGPLSSTTLQLVGLVTYYGKHYSTFFFHTQLREWIYFDDATVRAIGTNWEQVVDKCIRNHFQPLLLLYANPNGTPVNTELAPKEVTKLHCNKNFQFKNSTHKIDVSLNHHYINSNSDLKEKENLQFHRNFHRSSMQNRMNNSIAKCLSTSQKNQSNNNLISPLNSTNINSQNINYSSSDVPDSPCSKSTSSSFVSDSNEIDSGYISRRTVESILSLQHKHSLTKQAGKRNSSSSIDSFDICGVPLINNNRLLKQINDRTYICSLQRRDSGNSSGDRNSASSASVSSGENPYFTFKNTNLRPFLSLPGHRPPASPHVGVPGSDQGYDSFSLSSTDSYPSVKGTSSPGKLNSRLSQIPEDVLLMELINKSTMLDCDKLCSEADVLLLKSHEKEREGDLRLAAALSDSAAAKARSAMDAPYSNHQTLITAKMKHSMCVMRSASLHCRIKELDIEEKRRIKAEQMAAAIVMPVNGHNHSRQSSRDSTHSKHSRQGSKDAKDKSKEISKHASLEINKTKTNETYNAGKTLEIYATLPKKGTKKKFFPQGLSGLASLRIKNDNNASKDSIKRNSVPTVNTEHVQATPKINQKIDKISPCLVESVNNKVIPPKKLQNDLLKQSLRESDLSDYYSEWESTRRAKSLYRTFSGSTSCRENDSEQYGDVGEYINQSNNKKQHRVRRKLLMGGFMKRENRSLPDLREGNQKSISSDAAPQIPAQDDSIKTVAQISSKGFHQPHRAFITEQGLYQRPSLLKVKTPLIEKLNHSNRSNTLQSSHQKSTNKAKQIIQTEPRPPTPPKPRQDDSFENDSHQDAKPSNFLLELKTKRAEILKSCSNESLKSNTNNEILNNQTSNQEKSQLHNNNNLYKIVNDSQVQANDNKERNGLSQNSTFMPKKIDENNCKEKQSVKDLASKFQQIVFQDDKSVANVQNKTSQINENIYMNVVQVKSSLPNQNRLSLPIQSIPDNQSIHNDTLSKMSPSYLQNTIPMLPIPGSNSQSPSGINMKRPNKPPDYQTTIKRLGLLGRPNLNLPQGRQFYMTSNGTIGPLSPLTKAQSMPNSPQSPTAPFPLQENSKSLSFGNNINLPPKTQNNQSDESLNSTTKKRRSGFKKSVSFSDQVVLVACAEEEQEEYLPNPILERILGKNTQLNK